MPAGRYVCLDLSIMESRERKPPTSMKMSHQGLGQASCSQVLGHAKDGVAFRNRLIVKKGNTTYQSGQTRLAAAVNSPHPIHPTGVSPSQKPELSLP